MSIPTITNAISSSHGKISTVDWLGSLIFKKNSVSVQKSLKGVVGLSKKLANFWNILLWFEESKASIFDYPLKVFCTSRKYLRSKSQINEYNEFRKTSYILYEKISYNEDWHERRKGQAPYQTLC